MFTETRDPTMDLTPDTPTETPGDPATDLAADTGEDTGYDPGFDPGYDPGFDPGYDPGFDPGYDPGFDPGTDPGYDPGYDPSYDILPDGSVYVMSALHEHCGTKCAALGLSCAGYGSVGLDCGAHTGDTNCMLAGYWIWRDYGGRSCLSSWGTCDACTLNYNIYNAFCCHCY
jgi:hypothetical protein